MLDQPDASIVLASALPRGIKRKLSEDAIEEEESTWCSANRHNIYMWQRQSVLNISMCKLNHYRQVPNPSLRRSVLIFNTLRNIEEEMRNEMTQVSQTDDCIATTPLSELPGHMPTGADNSPPSFSPHPLCSLDMDQPSPPVPLFLSRTFGQNMDDDEVMVCDSSSSSCENGESGVKYFLDLDSNGRATPYISDHAIRTNTDWSNHQDDKPSILHWSSNDSFNNQNEHCNPSSYRSHYRFSSFSKPSRNNGLYCSDTDELESSNDDSAYSSPSSNCSAVSPSGSSVLTELDLSLYDFDLLTSPLPQSRLPALSAEELIRTFPAGQQPSAVNSCDSDTSDDSDSNERVLVGL